MKAYFRSLFTGQREVSAEKNSLDIMQNINFVLHRIKNRKSRWLGMKWGREIIFFRWILSKEFWTLLQNVFVWIHITYWFIAS